MVAENWLRDHSASLVSGIVADQVESIRTVLTDSVARGDNPTKVAKAIVGPVNRAIGTREGGIIGLTAGQARFVQSARDELLSGDPALLRNYLERGRRDKRFDRTVTKALKEQTPLPADAVDRIVNRYSAGLLKLRADTIALNETFDAMAAAKTSPFVSRSITEISRQTSSPRLGDTHRRSTRERSMLRCEDRRSGMTNHSSRQTAP